jgi:hypothetical protein
MENFEDDCLLGCSVLMMEVVSISERSKIFYQTTCATSREPEISPRKMLILMNEQF